MATSKVTPDADSIVCEIDIAAPQKRVFQALVDPREVVQWWGGRGAGQEFRCTVFESDLRVGGKWRSAGLDGGGRRWEVAGEYVEIEAPRLLIYSWTASWTGDVKTRVRWELQPTDQGTRVTLRHCDLATHPEVSKSYQGWPRMLGWLQAFLEHGETVGEREAISAN